MCPVSRHESTAERLEPLQRIRVGLTPVHDLKRSAPRIPHEFQFHNQDWFWLLPIPRNEHITIVPSCLRSIGRLPDTVLQNSIYRLFFVEPPSRPVRWPAGGFAARGSGVLRHYIARGKCPAKLLWIKHKNGVELVPKCKFRATFVHQMLI